MTMNQIIEKKRDGGVLSDEEIRYFVEGFTTGSIPDYQASALLMAIYFNGLNDDEIFTLTKAMRDSGDVIDLSGISGIKVDKHSSGGVGDKTTLIAAPLTAACGVPVAKMSGRGLGFTGGTVDKMESIPGFKTSLEPESFLNQVNDIGIAVIGQTAHVAPADKKIYALRDVTSTVENLGLISSSIMSKKLASGSDAILLDVKCGEGAFMDTEEKACELADMMCRIGASDKKPTCAMITDMNEPLGCAVGNSLEVIEVIETLKGNGPWDITELSLRLSGQMIYMGGKAENEKEGYEMALDALKSGKALEKLRQFIKAQGGDDNVIDDYSLFGEALYRADIKADESLTGYVKNINAKKIGMASLNLGAGRATKEDLIDMNAGIYLYKKTGDEIKAGDTLASLYTNSEEKLDVAIGMVAEAFVISTEPSDRKKLIKKVIGPYI